MKRQLTAQEIQDVISKLEAYLADLKVRWDSNNPQNNSWWKVHRLYTLAAAQFLVDTTDELIQFVESILPAGEDKKAAVLGVVGKLFDYIAAQFPFWLKPFVPTIKEIIVNVIVSHLIDFIVAKYNAGYWKMENTNATTN